MKRENPLREKETERRVDNRKKVSRSVSTLFFLSSGKTTSASRVSSSSLLSSVIHAIETRDARPVTRAQFARRGASSVSAIARAGSRA